MNEAEIWQIKQQAEAWEAVHDALSEGNPYFTGAGGTGQENAVAEVRRLYAVNAELLEVLRESLEAAHGLDVAPYGNAQVRRHFAAIDRAKATLAKVRGESA